VSVGDLRPIDIMGETAWALALRGFNTLVDGYDNRGSLRPVASQMVGNGNAKTAAESYRARPC